MKTYESYAYAVIYALLALFVPACVASGSNCDLDPKTGECLPVTAAASVGGGSSASGGSTSVAGNGADASSSTGGGAGCDSPAIVADSCHIDGAICGSFVCLCGIWIPKSLPQQQHVSCVRSSAPNGNGGAPTAPPVSSGDTGTATGDSGSQPPVLTTECSPTVLLATCAVTSTCNGTRGCTPQGTWGPCSPPSEVCNGKDDDCDGVIDNGNICSTMATICTPGQVAPCATGCTVPLGTAICGDTSQWISCIPPTEVCGNSIDDNCNGQTDEACTAPPTGGPGPTPNDSGLRKITYRFTVPSPFPAAATITVYDTAVDAKGDAVTRAIPLGVTYGDIHYGWGSAFDDSTHVCYVKQSGVIECVVHRPAGTTLKVNTEAVFGTGTFWSCNGMNGETFGLQEIFVDDVSQKLTSEPNPAGPYLGCRFSVKI